MVKWRSLVLVVLACILVLGVMAAPAAAVDGDDAEAAIWLDWFSILPIGWDSLGDTVPEGWMLPDIDGEWVVWMKAADASVDWNVYAYNIKSRKEKVVSTAAGAQAYPAISGDWVVYQDLRWGNSEIYAFNLKTNTEKRLTSRAGEQVFPAVSGTKVAYMDAAAGDIYVYDLAKSTESVLPLGAGTQTNPRVSGDRVVYVQSGEIYCIDLRTNAVTRITNDAVSDGVPDIDGTLIAWQRLGSGSDVWTRDLAGGSNAAAVATGIDEGMPRVSGKLVAYVQTTGGTQYDIGLYDKSKGTNVVLTTSTSNDIFAAIDGANIVYNSEYGSSGPTGANVMLGRVVVPILTAKAGANAVAYGGKTTISGTLTENGIELGGTPIVIERSTDDGHTWSQVASMNTQSWGAYSYTTAANYKKTLYRARYAGAGFLFTLPDHFSAVSKPVAVMPAASVGKPAGYPSTGKTTKTYSVYGSLKPRQAVTASTAGVVTLKCYRKQSGKWKLRKTVKAKVYNYSTYSRYKASVKLPYTGKWRVRAYFKGSATNGAKYSSYRYVTVK